MREFGDRLSAHVIKQHLLESYRLLAETATVKQYLIVFAERTTREQLGEELAPQSSHSHSPGQLPAPLEAA